MRGFVALSVAFAAGLCAQAQTLTSTSSADTGFALSGGTPGSWVRAALTRHKTYINERVNARRSGTSNTRQSQSASGSSSSNSSSSTLDLTNLLSQFAGSYGSLGSISGLSSLLGGQGTSTSGSIQGMDLASYIYALAASRNSGTTGTKTGTQATINGTTPSNDTTTPSGGALARLPKAEQLYQSQSTTTTDDRKFTARLLDSWAQAFFTALTLGFQQSDFIKILKDALRPLIVPTSSTGQNSGGSGGSSGTGGSSGSGGSQTGDGIENLSPPSGTGGTGGGSII